MYFDTVLHRLKGLFHGPTKKRRESAGDLGTFVPGFRLHINANKIMEKGTVLADDKSCKIVCKISIDWPLKH